MATEQVYETESDMAQAMLDEGFTPEDIANAQEQSLQTTEEPIDAPTEQTIPSSVEEKIRAAEEAGYTPDEIAEFVQKQGLAAPDYSQDENDPRVKQALALGYSREEVDAFLNNKSQSQVSETTPDQTQNDSEYEDQSKLDNATMEAVDAALADGVSPDVLKDDLLARGYDETVVSDALDIVERPSTPLVPQDTNVRQFDKTKSPYEMFSGAFGLEPGTLSKAPKWVQVAVTSLFNSNPVTSGLFETKKDVTEISRAVDEYQTIAASVTNAHQTFKQLADSTGIFGEEKQKIAATAMANMDQITVEALKRAKFDARIEDGEVVIVNQDGSTSPVDAGIWKSIKASKYEAMLSVAGEEIARRGVKGKIKSKTGILVSAAIGAGIGAASGKYFDLAEDAFNMRQKFKTDFIKSRMLQSGTEGAAFTAGIGVGLGAAALTAKGTVKAIKEGANAVHQIEVRRAGKALEELNFLRPGEGADIIEAARAKGVALAGRSEIQQYISALVQSGAKDFTKVVAKNAAGLADGSELAKMVSTVDARTKGALGYLKELSKNSSPKDLIEAYGKYEKGVKETYTLVKDAASEIAPNVKFSLGSEVLQPLEIALKDGMENPLKREQFVRMIRKLDVYKDTRNISDLIEVIPLVNQVKYSANTPFNTKKLLDATASKIRASIKQKLSDAASPEVAAKWDKDFTAINKEYAKMLRNRKNSIVKVLQKPGVTPDQITKVIGKYMDSPEVIDEALKVIPKRYAGTAEMSYFRTLTEKYGLDKTFSKSLDADKDAVQVIDWPKLSASMQRATPKSPEGRAYKHLVDQYAVMFRADPTLARFSSAYTKAEGRMIFHTQADQAAKANFLSKTFNIFSRFKPTQEGRAHALVHVTSKLLYAPTDAKTVERAIKLSLPEDKTKMKNIITDLQNAYREFKMPETDVKDLRTVKMDKGLHDTEYGTGRTLKPTSGGSGVAISTNGTIDASGLTKEEGDEWAKHAKSLLGDFTVFHDGKSSYLLDEPNFKPTGE